MRIMVNKPKITNEVFGRALELYYKKEMQDKVQVGKFLNHVFKLKDPKLERQDTYIDGLQYFKNTYVIDD